MNLVDNREPGGVTIDYDQLSPARTASALEPRSTEQSQFTDSDSVKY